MMGIVSVTAVGMLGPARISWGIPISFGRLVVGIALFIAGAACWREARVTRRVADAHQRFAILQYDADSGIIHETSSFLGRLLPWRFGGLRDEALRLRIELSYWRGQADENGPSTVAPDEPPAEDSAALEASAGSEADKWFATASTAFRAAQRLSGDRAVVVDRLDKVMEAYAEALRADAGNADASYNYEYIARYRDAVARGSGPVPPTLGPKDGEAGFSDLPLGLTIHGRPGASPPEVLVATVRVSRGGSASVQEPKTAHQPATEQPKAAQQPVTAQQPTTAQQPAAKSDPAQPRVFFVSPKDGEIFLPYQIGTFERPVVFEFGIENYVIAAVPDQAGQARPGMGHYHFGVDTECLPPGEVIPRRAPWVHLDDGETRFEMILKQPGKHTFTLQVGDDAHRAQAGLCKTLTLTVLD